jgi:hypothetical protein
MKSTSLITFIIMIFFFTNCGDNKAATNEKQEASTSSPEKKEESTPGSSTQSNDIVGEWEQQYTCYDKNGNNKLDPEEKKPSNTRVGFDWFRFNADGSCLRDKEVKFKSTYEIQNKANTKELMVHNVHGFTIVELTDEELILGAEGVFIVYKKIK